MPKVSHKQAAQAFAKYRIECPNDNTTTADVFVSWLEADTGAFAKYVDGNTSARPLQSLESFRVHASSKPISQETQSWDMALEQLSPEGLELIHLCAYLNPDNVPRSLLEQMVTEDLRAKVLSELCSQSLLINADNEGLLFRIQNSLQEAVRQQLAQLDKTGAIAKSIVEKGVEALRTIIGSHETTLYSDVWLFWKGHDYLNLQITRLIAEGEKLKIRDALLATLLEWAGEYQEHITLNFAESLNLYQRSLTIRKVVYKDNHPDITMSLSNIGGIYYEQDKYDQALEYLQQALGMRQIVYGNKHPVVARSLRSVGNVYYQQGQHDRALEYYEQALVIRRTAYGDNHPDVAINLSDIGNIHEAQGQYDKALEYYQQALAIRKTVYEGNHPDVASSFQGIANVYYVQAQYDHALSCYQQALAIYKATYGDKHSDVASSFQGVGNIYYIQEQYEKALEYYQQALIIYKGTYGDNDSSVATILDNIVNIYAIQGQHDKALEYGMVLERLSPESLEVIRLCVYLNPDCIPQDLLEQMVTEDLREKVLSELCSPSLLIEAEVEKGRLFKINRLSQEEICRQLASQDNTEAIARAIVEKGIGALKTIIGNHETMLHAEARLSRKARDYLNLQVVCLIAESEKLKISEALLATLLELAGEYQESILNFAESLNLYKRSLVIRKVVYSDNNPDIASNLQGIGRIYYMQGQYDRALEYYEQALAIRKTIYGDIHPNVEASLRALDDTNKKLQLLPLVSSFTKSLSIMKPEKAQEFKQILERIEARDESLKKVDLRGFKLGYADVLLLVKVLPQSQITSLELGRTYIGIKGITTLASALSQSQITNLGLGYNNIEDAGVVALAQALSHSQIINLGLENNRIGRVGAVALAQALASSRVINLYLGCNHIGDAGAVALAQVLSQSQITSLDLRRNEIEEGGATALAQALPNSQVINLNLEDNAIREAGANVLSRVLAQSQITILNLENNNIGDAGTVALTQGLALSQITSINLRSNRIGDAGVAALAEILPQSQVTSLQLGWNKIGDVGVTALAQALVLSHVITLDLGSNHIGDIGVTALVKALPQSQVTILNLGSNYIKKAGIAALAKVLAQSKVTSLDLEGNNIGGQGAATLAQGLLQSQIVRLDLGHNNVGSEGAVALAQALASSQITSINLRSNGIGDAGVAVLAEILPQSQITSLDLDGNNIGEGGAAALAQGLSQSKIVKLDLGHNNIGDVGSVALAAVLAQSHVTNLNLEDNHIGETGAAALAQVLVQSQITSINLENNNIWDAWANFLSNMFAQSQITSLDFGGNNMGDAGTVALAQNLAQSQVTILNLRKNYIGEAGAAALAQVLAQSQVTILNLEENHIGETGAAALAQVLAQSQITSINLDGNHIGDAGAAALAQALTQSQITSFNLRKNYIGEAGAGALAQVLAQSKVTSLNLEENHIGEIGVVTLAQVLAKSQVTSLNLGNNKIGSAGASALAKVLAKSKITDLNLKGNEIWDRDLARALAKSKVISLNLQHNRIGMGWFLVALAKALPQSQITDLDLGWLHIEDEGATTLAKVLAKSKVTSLSLEHSYIGNEGLAALAKVLVKSKVTTLNLEKNTIRDAGAVALANELALSKVTSLNLRENYILEAGAIALANALPHSQVTSFNLQNNNIGDAGTAALLQAVKSSLIIQAFELDLNETQKSILKNHLAINKLLNAVSPESKPVDEFIQKLESAALAYINNPRLLDDATFEKPKRLLLKTMELGSVQAIYLLGNLYLNELKNLTKAMEYYLRAATMGHQISKLCLEIIEQIDAPTKLELGALTIKLPRSFSISTSNQKLALRQHELTNLGETDALVSKTGISLAALNELQSIKVSMNVYVATKDYEPIDAGHLHFNQGQTIYINSFDNIAAINQGQNFLRFVKEVLAKSLIPYNRDKQGIKRADTGFIPYDMYLNQKFFQPKPRENWTAEDICNVIITPKTKPLMGEKSRSYVDTLPTEQRGKPFEGYILSYARSSKFSDILQSLNERFKDKNPDEVFIWIDLAGINQHAWMNMNSADIGKILEVNLTQLFTFVSEGRLIHFDKARPTNLTRSWCLVELLSCLKAQEHTVAKTEICMNSDVQSEVLAQDLMGLLNSLDSSKAVCFNPIDKIAIDEQIKRALTYEGETNVSMEIAFPRLNAQVKSWLVTKFLPDFSNVKELKQKEQEARKNQALVFSAPRSGKIAAQPEAKSSKKRCVLM